MAWFYIFALAAIKIWISTATKILYVLPDKSTNAASCPSQPCATLSQYLLDNGTLPVVSNVEYHFLPGEHHVPANMILQNLSNFSVIGFAKGASLPMLIGSSHSYVINIMKSRNIIIANVIFKQTNISSYKHLTNLQINMCYSCTVDNVTFINLGLIATNLLGNSYFVEIVIKLERAKSNLLVLCQGISLTYWNQLPFTDHKHLLVINRIVISGEGTGNECYNNDPVGINILILEMENLTIIINNSVFYKLDHSAVSVNNKCFCKNTIIFENCTFERNSFATTNSRIIQRPLVDIALSHKYKSITFRHCNFNLNNLDQYLISVLIPIIGRSVVCFWCNSIQYLESNIFFEGCHFNKNTGGLIKIVGNKRATLSIIGPSQFVTTTVPFKRQDVISISNMTVYISGPVIMSSNHVRNVVYFKSCDITFSKEIVFKSNNCLQVINLESNYIKATEYTNITLAKNRHSGKLIEIQEENEHKLYPFCIFQFITITNTTTISPPKYSINIENNVHSQMYVQPNNEYKKNCLLSLYHFTPHCKWIPTAAFHDHNPTVIYQQIIKINNQNLVFHKICHCSQNGSNNCSADTLGTVYPGQMLQVELCTPCIDEPSTLYAEVNSIHLPTSACKVVPQTDKTNTISKYPQHINFIIVSEATNSCELFLTAFSQPYRINEAFYVQILPCPFGFTLQSGVCDCDPVLSSYIDECHIDHSALWCPANTWISAYTQANNTTAYLISDCPMDYCLPYSSDINLLYRDLQCQFNRTGILCSQCHHHLSMVFGSSRCMKCTNLRIILIITIVIVAGIVLVVLLYLLNLTVTNGTINGIIFYANIISINDSVFLVNDNVFKPLRVFISFANLDLGIETCFYNGMDSYAKMWLQLFFPFYLIIIAASIIIASRYSARILRLTYTRSLPVLTTLFLLSYTGILRTVLTVLFSYSTITHLPSGHQQIVWSIDASVPLFGLKFTILFITCLVLFLLLIPFNITLLFTRYLLRFRIINHFKPLLDAFQGSYKDRYYYWVAVHVTLKSIFFGLYGFQTKLSLIIATMILILFTVYLGYIHPYKNKLVNIQELLLLINLTMMYAVSYQSNQTVFSIVTNVMISLVFFLFCTIVLYHILTYTCHCDSVIQQIMLKYFTKNNECQNLTECELLDIPECTYNYTEYQDGLVSDDFG